MLTSRFKILQQNISKLNLATYNIKRICHNQEDFSQECKIDLHPKISVTYHINRIKPKTT